MSEIKIRKATVADAQALVGIYSYYVTDTAVTFEWDVPSVEEFAGRIKNVTAKYPYFVAEVDGEIAGYAYANTFRSRIAYSWTVETSIYVKKDCRRGGVGKALLQELEAGLKNQNVLNVYAVIASIEKEDEYLTHDSVKFHDKMGYKKVSEWNQCGYKFKRWYNIVIMEKMLGEHTAEPAPVIPFEQ